MIKEAAKVAAANLAICSTGSLLMETLVVGRITAVFGVRGWVKVHSYTEQVESALLTTNPGGLIRQRVDSRYWSTTGRSHGDSLVVHIKGVDDRDIARAWCRQRYSGR